MNITLAGHTALVIGANGGIGGAVVWLASPAAAYTTGTVLTVDGGKGARGA
jgi:NAD(P)-dependent dehydrogenase (short-subunit alcohol dehydrogenase family)